MQVKYVGSQPVKYRDGLTKQDKKLNTNDIIEIPESNWESLKATGIFTEVNEIVETTSTEENIEPIYEEKKKTKKSKK